VVVIDTSWKMLAEAQKKGLYVIRANADRLPFATGQADGIMVVDAFHHFVEPSAEVAQEKAAGDMLRALSGDGRLLIVEPDGRKRAARVAGRIERLLLMRSRILPAPHLATLFTAAGARICSQQDLQFSVSLLLGHRCEPSG
jgi:demethylmenaquinone methyltransferase/2-methoxy-6-polyprenyl-1,4-benzoquinol methylase